MVCKVLTECRVPPSEATGLCIRIEVSCQVLATLVCFGVCRAQATEEKVTWEVAAAESPILARDPDTYLMSGKLRWPQVLCLVLLQ